MAMHPGRYVLYCLAMLAGQTASGDVGGDPMQENAVNEVAIQIAREYIFNAKGWNLDEFDVLISRKENNAVIVVDAVHRDDLSGQKGINKSVQLFIDVQNKKVIKELSYQ